MAAPSVAEMSPASASAVPVLTTIKITFDEPVTGVDPDDLVINADAATHVEGTGAGPYEFTFTQPLPGMVSVSWDFDHGIAGVSGSGAYQPEDGWTYELIDTLPPSIGTVRRGQKLLSIVPLPGATVDHLDQVEVRFNEIVNGVDASDLLVNDVAAATVEGEGAGPYVFSLSEPPAAGPVAFSWIEDPAITDPAGNAFEPNEWEVTLAPGERGQIEITEFMAANGSGITDADQDTSDWIELYNPGTDPVNLAGWALTTDPERPDTWVIPAKSIGPGRRLVIFASGKDTNSPFGKPHTNFTLDLSGGYLALFSPESPREEISAYVDYPEQRVDFSYGLTTSGDIRYFAEPTPDGENPAAGLTEVTSAPEASVGRGFFDEPFEVILSSRDPEASIHYTLNGSDPLVSSPVYTGPLEVHSTTILRAASYAPGKVASATVTHSYIYLDEVLSQPSPPYDNPDRDDDNDNPPLPTVGDVTFPITFGTQNGAGFPGQITNLPDGAAPADYGMDPEIVDDPNHYNDDGEIDEENGITNRVRIERALRELPLMSVVLDNESMFGAGGLHPNSRQKGTRYEFACSVELLLPDGTTGFDTTCGIRMHGNASREPRKCPKHGFKLNFKSTFGASRLTYPLFPDSPSREFDDIILRGDFNSSWLHWDGGTQRPKGTRMRDAFCKDTFRDMGRAAGHHRYVHLFLNGIYWGLYDATEQENNGFAANTFGGSKDDYDVVEQGQLKSGSKQVYDSMRAISGPITNAKYEEMKEHVDVPWLADYMLLHFFVGHQDWGGNIDKNWYAVRHHDGPFRYLPWDMENLMWDEDVNQVGVSSPPSGLHTKLVSNDEYLLVFADRVHKHLVAPDGALRPERNLARWNKWRAVVQDAIACEAARWGDYRRDVHRHQSGPYPLFTWSDQWVAEHARLTETWFPERPDIVLRQLRNRDLYPAVQAPQFKDNTSNALLGSQRVPQGFEVKITKASVFAGGILYYTTDGSDPRVAFDTTGERTPTAQEYESPIVINHSTVLRARALQNEKWSALMEATFTVGSPVSGIRISELHYNAKGSLGGSAAEYIELQNTSDHTIDLGKWSFQGIEFVFPWGTTVGPGSRVVVASNDAPNIFHAHHPGVSVAGYYRGQLNNNGERIALFDGDGHLVTAVEYDDESPWPAGADNAGPSMEIIDPSGDPQSPYNWRASEGPNGSPGLPNTVAGMTNTVVISEVLALGGDGTDFIELQNVTGQEIEIGGWQVRPRRDSETVITVEPLTTLGPGAYLTMDTVLPREWGEISLVDAQGRMVDGLRYGPQAEGYSFNRVGDRWQLGAPSRDAEALPVETAALADLRLNEWLADPSPGFDDWLEIINTNPVAPVELAGLHVGVNGKLVQIVAPGVIAPGAMVRLFCDRGARRADAVLLQLPASGGTLTLGDDVGDVFESVVYTEQQSGISLGRIPDGSGDLVDLEYPSPGRPNEIDGSQAVRINEVLVGSTGWVEILAEAEIDLAEWRLRTVSHSPERWSFPTPANASAGSHVVVSFEEDLAEGGPDHASGLPVDAGLRHWGLELINPQGQIIDRVTWGQQIAGQSIGRLADGSWALLADASPGSNNGEVATLGDVAHLQINEWFAASGDTSLEDSFLEFHNPSDEAIALGGLWLGDEPSEAGRRKWQIPQLSFIATRGYAAFHAANGRSEPNRFLFDLARGGEHLRLGAGEAGEVLIDTIGYGYEPSLSHSQGRLPDGGSEVARLIPTPGEANTDQQTHQTFDQWAAENGVTDPSADDDGDGLINMIEFLSGTDPGTPASSEERIATRENIRVREVDGRRFISIELSVDVDSGVSYETLVGELSPGLEAPWMTAEPESVEELGVTGIGTQKMRYEFAAPAGELIHFLRLRIEP